MPRGFYVEHIETLAKVSSLTKQLETIAKSSGKAQRLKAMPGVGLQTALAIEGFAPDMSCFERGREVAAWVGLMPMQHSTGGKDRLDRVLKMGQKDIRSLLITGAMIGDHGGDTVWCSQGQLAGEDAGARTENAGRDHAGQ